MTPALEIINLTKKYDDKEVVKNISFNIFPGEIFGLVGPNGAGKSTTLRMICGLTSIDGGKVYINGKSIRTNYKQAIAQVGAVVDTPQMYDYLSGIANLKIFASFYGKEAVRRIPKILQLVGMHKRAKDKFSTYSLGMKQRLGIAAALLNKPKVLILDEPTNGLDPNGIIELRNLIHMLAKTENIAVIISSHNLLELEQICDKIAFISKGRLIEHKSMEDIVKIMEANQKICIKVDYPNYAGKLLIERFNVDVNIIGNSVILPMDEAMIAEVISYLTKHNLTIFGFNKIQKSLEELYLEIIKKNDPSTSIF